MNENDVQENLIDNNQQQNIDLRINNDEIKEVKIQQNDDNKDKDKNNNNQNCDIHLGSDIMFGITFPGRIIMTLYSFHGLFFILNFIIQYIILVPGYLYEINNKIERGLWGIMYLIFALFTSNILVIPCFEFLSFPFLNFRYPLAHLKSFKSIIKNENFDSEKETRHNSICCNLILILIELIYFLGYGLGLASISTNVKDVTKFIILFMIYIYYLSIFLCYIFCSIYLIFESFKDSVARYKSKKLNEDFVKQEQKKEKIDPNKQDINDNIKDNEIKGFGNLENVQVKKSSCYNRICGCFEVFKGAFDFNQFFEKRKEMPDINLFSYVINPILKKNYDLPKISEEKIPQWEGNCYYLFIILRISLLLFSLILIIIVLGNKSGLSIFFFIIFFLLMLSVTIIMNFPFCFRNKKTYGPFWTCFSNESEIYGTFWSSKITYKVKLRHPNMISIIRFVCNVICLLASALLFFSFYFIEENDNVNDFPEFEPKKNKISSELLLPNICFSSIHNIPIYLYIPFINDAYYYNNNPKISPGFFSSFQVPGYKDLFYSEDYEIEIKGNLIPKKENNEESVKMIQYNVKNAFNEVTILSIKGTSNSKDIYLDFQLYFPSILLNILSTFSIFGQQKETYSFQFIEYSLSIPYRLFFQYLIIDGYLKDLENAYIDHQDSFYKNVIIVGHSLGGGLCKILGRLVKRQAISLSGPGVNAFHHLWGYMGNSENFEISAIDLVPDMDLVPRVEVSGGTVYRIICREGPLDCHSKVLSLCEILIMCRSPNYEQYCRKMANLNDAQIKQIYKSSELNNFQ